MAHRIVQIRFVALEGLLIFLCGLAAITGTYWDRYLLLLAFLREMSYVLTTYDFRQVWRRRLLGVCIVHLSGVTAIAIAQLVYLLMTTSLRTQLLVVWLVLTWATGARLCAIWLLGRPRPVKRLLILGTERRAVDIARELLARRSEGYQVVGFVGEDPALVGKSLINPCVIGTLTELEHLVQTSQASTIVVAMEDQRGRLPLGPLLRLKLCTSIGVEESAACYERITGKISTEALRPSRLIFADDPAWLRLYRRSRRAMDIVLALVGMIVSLPVMILTAIAVKLDSRGPVFYLQERVGLHNKRFKIIKFRSMRVNAEPNGPVWAGSADSRATRVGRLLRNLHFDELPQFANVLRGDMSIIGPRPERPAFVSQLASQIPYYSERHLVKPGLTGWAQVCYPYGASISDAMEKLHLDLFYMKNQSPYLDAIILLQTARMMLFGKWTAERVGQSETGHTALSLKQA